MPRRPPRDPPRQHRSVGGASPQKREDDVQNLAAGALQRPQKRPLTARERTASIVVRELEDVPQKQFWNFLRANDRPQAVSLGQKPSCTPWTSSGQLAHRLGMNCGHLEAFGARRNDKLLASPSSSTARPPMVDFCPPLIHRSACRLSSQKTGFSTESTGVTTNTKQLFGDGDDPPALNWPTSEPGS